ncbi:hypothetical protein FRC06_002802 [Ceratobasidium sp. 370]|nr:hypothetical protein FRC06_002802 [Ceratobasidium sp. 370]
MSSSNSRPPPPRSAPSLAPDDNPQHDTNPKPATRKLTPQGTPYPIWKIGDMVMVPVDKPKVWRRAIVVARRVPIRQRGKTDEEFKKLSPSELSRFEPIYDVVVEPEVLLRDVPERYIVPDHLDKRLWENRPHFKIGEKAVVLLPEGGRMQPYVGHISHISDDHVVELDLLDTGLKKLFKEFQIKQLEQASLLKLLGLNNLLTSGGPSKSPVSTNAA